MTEPKKSKNQESCLKLPSTLDISSTHILHKDLTSAIQKTDVRLDASSITRITSPSLQVLCAFIKECQAQSKKLTFYNPSSQFKAEVANFGLEREFFNNPNVQVDNG